MQFNSIIFLLSLTIFILFYFFLKNNNRKALLLIGNLLFYLSFGINGLIVLISILLIVYIFGIIIEKTEHKKLSLILGIFFVLLFLITFKYLNFLTSFFLKTDLISQVIKLSIPIGISFYSFSSLSYLIEVYRKRIISEKRFFDLAQYVSFFPLIVSGPIERPYNLIPQFKKEKHFDYENIKGGLILITLGYFKKVVLADRLAEFLNKVYDNPSDYKGIALIVAAILFSIQIYCDFSGYTDIAVGIAKIMGFKISENFNLPYYSKSIKEFWTRWHITLSTWLRDYIFLPVAYSVTRKLNNKPFIGIKSETWSYIIGIIITMFICGLWHGANWTFIIWGMMYAFLLIFAFLTKKIRKKILMRIGIEKKAITSYLRILFTFSLITILWIFFRSNNINDALYIISNFFNNYNLVNVMKIFSSRYEFYVTISFILILELIHLIQRKHPIIIFLNKKPVWQRWCVYYFFILIILIFGRFDSASFIYAKF